MSLMNGESDKREMLGQTDGKSSEILAWKTIKTFLVKKTNEGNTDRTGRRAVSEFPLNLTYNAEL